MPNATGPAPDRSISHVDSRLQQRPPQRLLDQYQHLTHTESHWDATEGIMAHADIELRLFVPLDDLVAETLRLSCRWNLVSGGWGP